MTLKWKGQRHKLNGKNVKACRDFPTDFTANIAIMCTQAGEYRLIDLFNRIIW